MHGDPNDKEFFFFVDNTKYSSLVSTLTGAQIKAMIPNFDPGYGLYMEGPGNDPDVLIQDNTTVTLEKEKGPKRFYTVPPATFG
jgi:hypothetical protein